MLFVRSSAILKSFLSKRDLHFLQKFQRCFFFLSKTQVHKFSFLLMDLFFITSAFFRISQSEDFFLVIRKTRPRNRFNIWVVTSLKSTPRQGRYNRFKSYIFSSTIRTAKISCSKKDIFNSAP